MVVVRIACGVETGHAFVSGGMTYNVMICVLLFVDRVTFTLSLVVEAVPQSGYLTVTDELERLLKNPLQYSYIR